MRDERRHQYEIRKERNEAKNKLEIIVKVKNKYKKLLSQINEEARKWRKIEKSKYNKKADHIRNLRIEDEEKELQTCPKDLEEYKDLKVFNKEEMEALIKEEVKISKIGEVELDSDEIALLKLPPKFAIRNKLDIVDMKTDMEMSGAKIRYQTHK